MKAGSRTSTPAPRSVATPTSEVNTEGNWRWTFTGKQPTAMTPMRNLRPPTASPADSGYERTPGRGFTWVMATTSGGAGSAIGGNHHPGQAADESDDRAPVVDRDVRCVDAAGRSDPDPARGRNGPGGMTRVARGIAVH